MQNKRIKKKIAKNNFCKSPVWHGAKIKTKDVRVQTYRGKFCDYGLVESERPKLALFAETLGAQAITVIVQIVYGYWIGKIR